ncbi:DoxX family protein [bacterium]|nr:DoxX family protein [bacterium]
MSMRSRLQQGSAAYIYAQNKALAPYWRPWTQQTYLNSFSRWSCQMITQRQEECDVNTGLRKAVTAVVAGAAIMLTARHRRSMEEYMFGMKRNMDNCEMCQGVFLLVSRVLLSYIFLSSGFKHLSGIDNTMGAVAGKMSFLPAPLQPLFAWGAVALLIIGGLMVLAGFKTRIGVMLLVLFLLPTLFFFHNFWAFPAEEQQMQSIQFNKNLAIIGGLFALFVKGAGNYSIDGLLRRGKPVEAPVAH